MNQIYVAGSFYTPEEKKELQQMIDQIRLDYPNYKLYIPMEHFVPGGNDKDENGNYIMPNHVWGRKVFEMDKSALDASDIIIALYKGRYSGTGTAWEIGYAYAMNIPIILYVPEDVETTSLMVINCAYKVIGNLKHQR